MAIRLIQGVQLTPCQTQSIKHEASGYAKEAVKKMSGTDLKVSAMIQLAGIRADNRREPGTGADGDGVVIVGLRKGPVCRKE